MLRWNDVADVPADTGPRVVTLGNFDGVHRGHAAVLQRVRAEADARGAEAVAVTFDPHPLAVLAPERAPSEVCALEYRLELLAAQRIDATLVMEFTKALAAQTPEEFVRGVFVEALGAVCVVVGRDTRFGVRNSGDVDTLRELGGRYGFDVVVVEDIGDPQEIPRWSSTAARERISGGDVAGAAAVLGRPHRVTGVVVHGHHRGRELGFPTANLDSDSDGLVPADGVYAGWFERLDIPQEHPDRRLPCAVSVGTNPQFEGTQRTVEAYVLDRTDLDLYGERVAVDFVERVRGMRAFDSLEMLIDQMSRDVEECRRTL